MSFGEVTTAVIDLLNMMGMMPFIYFLMVASLAIFIAKKILER